MKTYIYIDNFRGFSNQLIPLSQVNFLVGENSTGKTSLIELIDILSYMPYWIFEPRFGAPNVQAKHYLDLVSVSSKSKESFCVGAVEFEENTSSINYGMLVTYVNIDGRPSPRRVSIVHGGSVRTIDGKLWRYSIDDASRVRTKEMPEHTKKRGSLEKIARQLVSIHKSSVGFKSVELSDERKAMPLLMKYDIQLLGRPHNEPVVKIPKPFQRTFVDIAPIRTKPKRTYDAPQTEFSPEGEHTPYVIKKTLSSKAQAALFQKFIESFGSNSGLFNLITIKPYGRGPRAPFEMHIWLGGSALGLENVGYGVSQALPVLVEMFIRPRKSAFAIQQPEVHLHPRAQAAFGDVVAELARSEDKCFMIETHSDFAIDRFRLNVKRDGVIASQLLFFERKDNGNVVTPIEIGNDGELSESQPKAYRSFFFNESLELLR